MVCGLHTIYFHSSRSYIVYSPTQQFISKLGASNHGPLSTAAWPTENNIFYSTLDPSISRLLDTLCSLHLSKYRLHSVAYLRRDVDADQCTANPPSTDNKTACAPLSLPALRSGSSKDQPPSLICIGTAGSIHVPTVPGPCGMTRLLSLTGSPSNIRDHLPRPRHLRCLVSQLLPSDRSHFCECAM